MDFVWSSNYWFLAFIIPAFIVFKQSEKLIFSNFRYQPDEIFAEPNTLKRYLVFIRENIFRLYESYIITRIILFLLFSYFIINSSIELAKLFNLNSLLISVFFVLFLTLFSVIAGLDLISQNKKIRFIKILTFPVYWLNVVISPIIEIVNEFVFVFDNHIFNNKLEQNQGKIGEFFWGETINEETPNEDEIELIDGIVSFKEISAKEVMTPRTDIVSISDEAGFQELLDLINSTRHSRIPLYNGDLDNITGIIYAKDLLPFLADNEKTASFQPQKAARKAFFIPETKMIKDLLSEFQEKKMHVAIVIDEFGSTAGLISLEDIIEEIVGEIRDELDVEENPVIKINENSFLVLGKVSIEELNELLEINIPVLGEYDSIAGFILSSAGEFPKEGYSYQYENVLLTVKEIINKRIKKVLVEKSSS